MNWKNKKDSYLERRYWVDYISMRCKGCGFTASSSVTTHAHCWQVSQQCAKCHYLGIRHHRSFKYSDEDIKKRERRTFK